MTSDELKLAAEYHRGFEDGKAACDADEWALQQKRIQAMNRVDDYITSGYPLDDSPFWLPTLPGVIHALLDTDTYCLGDLVDGLKELLGADEDVKKPLVEYDVLGNERHKAICELRKLADAIDDGQWVGMYELGEALGFDLYRTHHNPIRKILQLFVGDEYDDEFYEPRPLSGNSIYCCILDELDENGEIVNSENLRGDTTDVGCDDLLDLLRDAARDYRSLQQADELRTHVLDAAIEENKSLRKKLDQYDETHIKLPRDADANPVKLGDALHDYEDGNDFHVDGFKIWGRSYEWWAYQENACQYPVHHCLLVQKCSDMAESIIRDLTLGNISESDAIARIEKLGSQHEQR